MRLFVGTTLAFASLVCLAQIPKTGPKQPNEQWVSLFNGKDLTGWAEVGHEKWEVVDGVIHGQGITQDYGYLRTEGRYKHFHMSAHFKAEGEGKGGVSFIPNSSPAPRPSRRACNLRSTRLSLITPEASTAMAGSGSCGRRRRTN